MKKKYPECLLDINLEVVGKFTRASDHHKIKCLECNNTFKATPKSKIQNYKVYEYTGCPDCTWKKKYKKIDANNIKKIKELGFEILSEYNGRKKPLKVMNKNCNCGRAWYARAESVIEDNVFCRPCNDERKRKFFQDCNIERSKRSLKKLKGYKKYLKTVRILSEQEYRKYEKELTNNGQLIRGRNNYHLDHIVPISFCYKNNIPEELCSHIDNLKLINENSNISKNSAPSSGIPKIFKDYISSYSLIENFINSIINTNLRLKYEIRKDFDIHEASIYFPHKKIAISLIPFELYCEDDVRMKYILNMIRQKYLELGIRGVFIYEDEWIKNPDLILSKIIHIIGISRKRKIYARKCYIKQLDSVTKKIFLDKNHIQGSDNSQIKLGLFDKDNDELVSVMTFSRPRIFMTGNVNNRDNDYELSRFASNTKYIVIGAFSKLLTYFEKEYEYNKIYSFADLRWSDGRVYETLGFKLNNDSPPPGYRYIIDGESKHRWNFRKEKIKEKFPEIYDKNKTEYQMMQELGYNRIWDCGHLKFEKLKNL